MFLNLTITSRGRYAIFATVRGSMNEEIYTQVSRARIDAKQAATRAYALAQDYPRYTNVTLKDVVTGKVVFFEREAKVRRVSAREYVPLQTEAIIWDFTRVHSRPAGTAMALNHKFETTH